MNKKKAVLLSYFDIIFMENNVFQVEKNQLNNVCFYFESFMKYLLKAFPIIFIIFFYDNSLKASGINCSSPVYKNKAICKSESKKKIKLIPKNL